MIRLAINGYGRIGRCILRALYECNFRSRLQVVAINEPADLETIVHLTRFDSTHGRFHGEVSGGSGELFIAPIGHSESDTIVVSHHQHIQDIQWPDVDIVLDCSGLHSTEHSLSTHLARGAKRVLLSQPGEQPLPAIVFGLNHERLSNTTHVASAASCTTNCILPVLSALHGTFGIEAGNLTTIHSVMNDQPVLDGYHASDLRKTRAAGLSIIPVDTGLAEGIGRILPELEGRFTAKALRVPTHNVSAMELSAELKCTVTAEEVNKAFSAATTNGLGAIMGVNDEPLSSCDFNHDRRSGIIDLTQTRATGRLVNVLTWFDNEWAYANRMLDITDYWSAL